MPDFRRGAEAIADAQKKAQSNGGSFTPFTPSIFWQDPAKDTQGAERYIMFLNKLSDIPGAEFISFIPQKGKKGNGDAFTYFESVIARTDPVIGEDVDPMVRDWDAQPRDTNLAVAVSLVPVLEDRGGRKRAVGFEVEVTEFDRRIRDDEGELTEETETVEAPVVGFVQQSPHNFFNLVSSFDADTGPIESTALKIKRIDQKTYTVEGFLDVPIDLSGLVDCIENLSYLSDESEELIEELDQIEDDQEAAEFIGAFLLDKRLEELVDEERYNKLFETITETLNKFGGKEKKGKAKEKKERPARRSSRRSRNPEPEAEESAPVEEEAAAPDVEPEEQTEEKPARRRRSRAKAAEPEAEAEAPAETPAEEAPEAEPEAKEKPKGRGRATAGKSKLDELRDRQEKRRAAAAA